jgi:hypothetical protein
MTQKERDRLVALKKAKKKLITQKQAAAEIGVSEHRGNASAGPSNRFEAGCPEQRRNRN